MRESNGIVHSMFLLYGTVWFEIKRMDGQVEVVEATETVAIVHTLVDTFGRMSNVVGKKVRYTVDITGRLCDIDTVVPR